MLKKNQRKRERDEKEREKSDSSHKHAKLENDSPKSKKSDDVTTTHDLNEIKKETVEAVDGSAAEGSKIDLVGHGSTCDQNVKTEILNDEDDEMEEEFEDPDEVDDDVDMVDVPQPDSALRV